jgi:hypothetical protein
VKLEQQISEFSGKRIYVDEHGFRYASISTLAGFFGSTIGLYKWNLKLGKQIAADLDDAHLLSDRELYLLGKPEGDRICKESAELGTKVHAAIETNMLTGDEECDAYVEQYRTHIAPHLEIYHQEIILGHVTPEGLRMAGTCDLLGAWKSEDIVGDWKTSESPKKKAFMGRYALQLAAYDTCLDEPTNKGVIFNLCSDHVNIFHIPLEPAKEILLTEILPAFYEFYRLPECDRPYPNQFRNLGVILSAFEKDLAKSITIE